HVEARKKLACNMPDVRGGQETHTKVWAKVSQSRACWGGVVESMVSRRVTLSFAARAGLYPPGRLPMHVRSRLHKEPSCLRSRSIVRRWSMGGLSIRLR